MKTILIFITCCNLFVLVKGQSRRMTLPLYKKSPKIDSLFECIIANNRLRGAYFSFTAIDSGDSYLFAIEQLDCKPNGIHYSFMQPKYMVNFGYFLFKGRLIFVSGGIDPFRFFKKTKKRRSFKFIGQNKDNAIPNNFYFATYRYEKGQFSLFPLEVN